MTGSRIIEAPRAGWASAVLTALTGAALALGSVLLVGRYYAFYHLGGPGAALGLLLVALPLAVLCVAAVALWGRRRALRRGASAAAASTRGAATAAALLALMLALEFWRTASLRGNEGGAPGNRGGAARTLVDH